MPIDEGDSEDEGRGQGDEGEHKCEVECGSAEHGELASSLLWEPSAPATKRSA